MDLPCRPGFNNSLGRWGWVPKTTAYKRWNCQVIRPANGCLLIPFKPFPHSFPDPSQFAAAKLTHYSTMPHRPSDSSWSQVMGTRILALLPSIRVYKQRHKTWGELYVQSLFWLGVHSKCYGLHTAAEYRRIKNWTGSSCSSPPIPQSLPSPNTTKASDGDPFTILQFNANGIGNKQVELGEFLGRHKVKMAVIQESKLTLKSRMPNIQNFTTVRKNVLKAKDVVYSH